MENHMKQKCFQNVNKKCVLSFSVVFKIINDWEKWNNYKTKFSSSDRVWDFKKSEE